MFGWAGKILHVDLTKDRIWEENLSKNFTKKFLGGRGINARLLWDLTRRPGLNPLSRENVLIFGTGTLTCTTAPSSSRTTVTCKSPCTNLYLKSSMGGHWGAELKFAGYDHLIIHGASEKPVYLRINNNVVELKDASHLWGSNVKETTEIIKKEVGDKHTQVACIGPAGENLAMLASIMCSVYNAAGRGGAGAVMGSKKLKAIATRGNGEIVVKDPKAFEKVALAAREAFWNDPQGLKYWQWGTGGFLVSDKMSSYNYSKLNLDGGGSLTAPWMLRKRLFSRRHGCFGCSQSCHRYIELMTGPYAGIYTCGPEYETYASLGAQCGIIDVEYVVKANDLANIMGMDTISLGHLISWAMESYERGVLTKKDTGGMELTFGNADAAIKLIPMIARREGIGDLLANGIKQATEKIGKGSHKWASFNSKGLDQSGMDNRLRGAYALAFAVNPRGPDHLHSECMASFGWTPHQRELIEEVTGHRWITYLKL
jgi:aldehyde:ferredoxin oxidoreductase